MWGRRFGGAGPVPALAAGGLVLALTAAACDGGGRASPGTFAVSPSPKPPGGTAGPGTGRLKPPSSARMFAGTESLVGALTRYCDGSACLEPPEVRPKRYLEAPEGGFVVFTLGAAPLAALAEVRSRPSEPPAKVPLSPGTLMVFNHGLGRGRYLVTLVVRWRASEAHWRFGLTVT